MNAKPNNNGTLTGRIASKALAAVVNGTSASLRFPLAVDRFVPKDKYNDPNYKKSDLLNVVAFGDDAKNIAQWGVAGKWMQIIYHLGQSEWEDKVTKAKRYGVDIIIDSWSFLPVVSGNTNKGAAAVPGQELQPPVGGAAPIDNDTFFMPSDEEPDLPF